MSEIITTYNEKDLFVYLQKDRLLTAKKVSGENMENTAKVKEEKKTVKGFFKNVGNFFKRSANSYEAKDEAVEKALKDFEKTTADNL